MCRILVMSITDIAPYTPIFCGLIGAVLTSIAAFCRGTLVTAQAVREFIALLCFRMGRDYPGIAGLYE